MASMVLEDSTLGVRKAKCECTFSPWMSARVLSKEGACSRLQLRAAPNFGNVPVQASHTCKVPSVFEEMLSIFLVSKVLSKYTKKISKSPYKVCL
jgi:hypothetical protein